MKNIILPKNYESLLSIYDTQVAIKLVKDTFEEKLAKELSLIRVSAPIFVDPLTGLNDNLSGFEKAVSFTYVEKGKELEVVQSLAKWKRNSLKKYGFDGIYTDMNAIRPYEELDNIHSIYVDQWDWERKITPELRNEEYLKETVRKIYKALKETEDVIYDNYPKLYKRLPHDIAFVTSEQLEEEYKDLTPKERENLVAKKFGAVFLMHIGGDLKNGQPHDLRAADYDDWQLNGDILVYDDVLEIAFEISSMGIRVNKDSLKEQLVIKHEEFKFELDYHKNILNDDLPLSIGGGIGQSRMCMYMLHKAHIGEVQASYWPKEEVDLFKKNNIHLL